jgi:hypothetical protein
MVTVPEWCIYASTGISMIAMLLGYIIGRVHGRRQC